MLFMNGRLVVAIITTTLEEIGIVVVVLWGLPKVGINIPLWIIIPVMVAWCTYTVVTYRMGSLALKKKPTHGLRAMLDSEGLAVSSLEPRGMVRINGELWQAESTDGNIEAGEKVTVVGQDRLKFIVRKCRD
ncbi:NfeD family protein [Chloroflexota bacterium]